MGFDAGNDVGLVANLVGGQICDKPDQHPSGDTIIPLAYTVVSDAGQIFVRLTTPSVELARTYQATAAGASPTSPVSVLTRTVGGFKDKVNNHYLRTSGSAALLAIIGTGIDMAVPESSARSTQDTASYAVLRNFAEVFGNVVEQTINKNLGVQPKLQIRPGYNFNILVDRDIILPGSCG